MRFTRSRKVGGKINNFIASSRTMEGEHERKNAQRTMKPFEKLPNGFLWTERSKRIVINDGKLSFLGLFINVNICNIILLLMWHKLNTHTQWNPSNFFNKLLLPYLKIIIYKQYINIWLIIICYYHSSTQISFDIIYKLFMNIILTFNFYRKHCTI